MELDPLFGPLLGGPPLVEDLVSLRMAVEHQRGLVTTAQCLAGGLSEDAIRHRTRIGRWVTLRRGVHLTVPGLSGWWFDATSALLCAGHGAAWGFQTAAYAQGLIRLPPPRVHLVVDAAFKLRSPPGVVIHRSRHADRRVDPLHWPWRTRPEETILDLAERASVDELAAILGRALSRGVTSESLLVARLAERRRHRQRAIVVDMVTDVGRGAESAMELRFLRDVVRPHGLPTGRRQAPTVVGGVRIHDVAYDDQHVLVELDGRLGHDDEGRVRDGVRDRRSATGRLADRPGVLARRGRNPVRAGRRAGARPHEPGLGGPTSRVRATHLPLRRLIVGTFRRWGAGMFPRCTVSGAERERRCVADTDFVILDASRRRKPGLDLTGPGPFVRSTP
jgi:hypothetical protein